MMMSGREVFPLVEGGKGVSVSTGLSSGAWAAAGGVGEGHVAGAVERDFTDARWQAAWKLVGVCAADDQKDIAPAIIAGYMLASALDRLAKRDAARAKGITPGHRIMPSRVAHVMVPKGGQ